MNFSDLHTNFLTAAKNLDDTIVGVISEHEDELIDLNTSQLEEGIDVDGLSIEPEYAFDDYADLKKAMGSKAPKGTPNLKLEGDFYKGYRIENIQPKYTEIESTDEKAGDLERKYGSGIYGLTEKNKGVFSEIMTEPLKEEIHGQLTQ